MKGIVERATWAYVFERRQEVDVLALPLGTWLVGRGLRRAALRGRQREQQETLGALLLLLVQRVLHASPQSHKYEVLDVC
jgi:hypothetical protein